MLSSRPAEAEHGFAHVVLADLLEDVVPEVLPTLSAPRRRALEGALLMGRTPEDAPDPRALGVAVRTCFQVLVEKRPLVLAVDDSQWVDSSSATALAFALRRLRAEHILLLLARRVDERGGTPGIEESIDVQAVERLRVGPLSIGAMHLLLQQRLGCSFARPTLRRLHEISGGNPFYALELAGGLGSGGAVGDSLEPLRVPETLERLVGARLAGLGGATREALLLTAAHGRPSLALLGAAGINPKVLEPASMAHVIELSTEAVRFTHPLLASVLYHAAPEEEQRGAHGRLAAVVDDPIERARHLGLAADTPDEEVAAALESAATLARARGTIIAAADLAEHALRLTPSDALEDRQRRTIAAARAHLDGGDANRARELADGLVARTEVDGRADALVLLSDIEYAGDHLEHAIDLRRAALEAAAAQPALQAEIHQWLGAMLALTEGVASADRHAVTSLKLAEGLGNDGLRAAALSTLGVVRFRAGVPGALSLVEQAAQLGSPAVEPWRWEVDVAVVFLLVWSYEIDRARTLLKSMDRDWSERDELRRAYTLWWLAMVEFRSGRFPLAADYAERAGEIVGEYAIDDFESPSTVMSGWRAGFPRFRIASSLVALIAAHRGELDRARTLAESNRPLTEGLPFARSGVDAVLALVELWSGDPGAAAARFAAAEAGRRGSRGNEPAMFTWRADYAEALVGLGRLDEAAALVDTWEAEAARLGREAVLAHATRCRGLFAAARGEVEDARAELERAVAQHEAVGDRFGRARALLALGIVRRRARQKRGAREAITAALDGFEASGAAGWAERARAELGTIGGRTRIEGLTPAEGRIAALVAKGQTNREVAAALFLTEHTVATALTRVYRKLGVRSRTELARLEALTQDANPAKT